MRKVRFLIPAVLTVFALTACGAAAGGTASAASETGVAAAAQASSSAVSSGVAAAAPAAQAAAAVPGNAAAAISGSVITVTGTGKVTATPDQAQINVGVRTSAPTAQDSQQANTEQVNALIEHLKSLGVDEKDITTSGYYLNAEYDWSEGGNGKIIGYNTSVDLAIRNQPVADVGRIISESVAAGANQFQGISFSVSNYDELYTEALASGVASARVHAEALAAAAGKTLGEVVSISEGNSSVSTYQPVNLYLEEAAMDVGAAKAVNVQPGQQEISAPVTVTYLLK